MATSASTTPFVPYGMVTIDGVQYVERPQIYATEHTITFHKQVFTNLRLTLPGTANFLLKALTRDITIPHLIEDKPGSQDRRFRFRLLNAEGSTWYYSGGLGVIDDRVVDTLCFGNGQFPYPLIPPIPVAATGTLIYEIEDMGLDDPQDPDYFPYTIHFGWQGCLLIPAALVGDTQSIVYAA